MTKGFYGWPHFIIASFLLQALVLSSVSLSKTGIALSFLLCTVLFLLEVFCTGRHTIAQTV